MIPDARADTVFIADTLDRRFPAVADGLRRILDAHGIPVRTIVGTRDIWCRDYMPIQTDIGEFARFRYDPDYLKRHQELVTRPTDIEPIPEIEGCRDSEIVLDGGNVVGHGSRCIVTDKVFRENLGMGRAGVLEALRELLRAEELIVIPEAAYSLWHKRFA
jgi:hypothetical protein